MKFVKVPAMILGMNSGYDFDDPRYAEHHTFIQFEVPDSIEERVLIRYVEHWYMAGSNVTTAQLEAIIELLIIADEQGHDVNELLTIATANCERRVVYDNHLKPNEKNSFYQVHSI